MTRTKPFTIGDRLRSRLFEQEQGFKSSGYTITTRRDRAALESHTRLRQTLAAARPAPSPIEVIVDRTMSGRK